MSYTSNRHIQLQTQKCAERVLKGEKRLPLVELDRLFSDRLGKTKESQTRNQKAKTFSEHLTEALSHKI